MRKKSKSQKKLIKGLSNYTLHIFVFVGLVAVFLPIARFYWQTLPVIGADFYQAPAYVSYYQKFLSFPVTAWKYIWFSGVPTMIDHPWLHFYTALPLTNFFSAVQASQIYLLFTLFLYFIFAYLLFWQLSKNKILSLGLTLVLMLSENIYHALFRGGSTIYSASQMFVPLALFFLVRYLQGKNRKYFYLSILTTGFAFIGHPAIPQIFLVIPALLLIFFWIEEKTRFFQWKKIKDCAVYLIISVVIGFTTLYPILFSLFTVKTETNFMISFNTIVRPEAIIGMIDTTNYAIIVIFLILLLGIFAFRRFGKIRFSLPFLLMACYMLIFEWAMQTGHNPFASAIGAMRTYWFFLLILGCIISIFWQSLSEFKEFLPNIKKLKSSVKEILVLFVKIGVILILIFPLLRIKTFVEYLKDTSQPVALIPDEANEATTFDKKELVDEVLPSWMDAQDQNHRFYVSQPSVLFWFNVFYKMPIFGGYYNPLLEEERNWPYWLDTSLTREGIEHFNSPEEVAERDVLFLIDWYGIKYLMPPVGPYLTADYFFKNNKYIENEEASEEKLNIFEVKSEFTSPIIKASNAPRLLVVGSSQAYNTTLRVLAKENLNSQYIIPIKGPEKIDDIIKEDLSQFEAILLFDYRYKKENNFKTMPQKPWQALADYVKNGGHLIIETGEEVKESDIRNIPGKTEYPEVFPISKNTREGLGMSWQAKAATESLLLKDVSIDDFSSLVYQDSPWKLSYAELSNVRSWAEPVISQKNYPVLVEGDLGEGKVVWSGMNLFNHIQSYHNFEESRLFRNILLSGVELKKESNIDYTVERPRPENIEVKGNNFRGVLFKENDFGGWQAKAGETKLKIHRAGPNFMYVLIPPEMLDNPQLEIYYGGTFGGWFFFILSSLAVLLIVIYLFIGQKIIKLIPKFGLDKKVKKWWEKDEDEE